MKIFSRRSLLIGAGAAIAGSALVLSVPLARRIRAQARQARPLGGTAWLTIEPSGRITAATNIGEMGQGAVSGLLKALADELDADWQHLRFEFAPVTEPYKGAMAHYTGDSLSIRIHLNAYRRLGASARAMLVKAAADRWSVPEDECTSESSVITHTSSTRRLHYGELAAEAGRLRVPFRVRLKSPSEWRYIGRPALRLDLPGKVDGSARFGIDFEMPGMKIAAIRHCPVKNGRLLRVAAEPALAIKGVHRVVQLPDAVGVVADGYWAAQQGANALQPDWDIDPKFRQSSADLGNLLDRLLVEAARQTPQEAQTAFAAGSKVIEATYEVPLLAQAPMEPMNATAHVHRERAEIWAPTQAGSQCRQQVAEALGIPIDVVTIHPLMMGGGFGRRLHNDYAVEAALIAREVDGPVKVIWSREEDFLRTTLRTAAKARLRATLGEDGMPVQLVVDLAALAQSRQMAGLQDQPYRLPRVVLNYAGADSAARLGFWRSVSYSHNVYFLERFLDECATTAAADPFQYRLALLEPGSRNARTLEALAEICRSASTDNPEIAVGIAHCAAWGSYISAAVEIYATVDDPPKIRAIRIVADCGLVVDPGSVRAQLEGGALQALSATSGEAITLTEGRVNELNFDSYQLGRFADAPEVQVTLLDGSAHDPGGVGELSVPVIAPALANAIARSRARFRPRAR